MPASRAANTREPRSSPRSAVRPTKGSSCPSRAQSTATTWRHTSSGYHARRWRMAASSPASSAKTSPAVTSRTACPVSDSQSPTSRSRVGSTPSRETARSRAVSTWTRCRTTGSHVVANRVGWPSNVSGRWSERWSSTAPTRSPGTSRLRRSPQSWSRDIASSSPRTSDPLPRRAAAYGSLGQRASTAGRTTCAKYDLESSDPDGATPRWCQSPVPQHTVQVATHRDPTPVRCDLLGALRGRLGGPQDDVCRRARWGTTAYVSWWLGGRRSPTALGEPVRLRDLVDVDADHGLAEAARHLGDDVRVVVEGRRLDDRLGALGRVAGLEDAGADEDALGAELHHHGGVGGGRDAAGGEEHDGELAGLGDLLDELVGGLQLLGRDVELVGAHRPEPVELGAKGAHVRRRVGDVARAGLTLGADHRRALGDAAQGLAEVGRAADEGHGELPLVDVVGVVGGREHLGLVD